MGFTKRRMEEQDGKRQEAVDIAVEAGSLERCPFHRDYISDTGDSSMAYKLANKRFTDDNLQQDWASRRELTDMIQEVIENSPGDGICPSCESF